MAARVMRCQALPPLAMRMASSRSLVSAAVLDLSSAIFVGRSSCAERDADENAALFGVHSDPERVAVLPVDLVPGGLNSLRNFDGLAAVENVQAGATRDDHLVFADADPAHGRRADFARNFGDGLGST